MYVLVIYGDYADPDVIGPFETEQEARQARNDIRADINPALTVDVIRVQGVGEFLNA